MTWVKHTASPMGRSIASDLPVEVRIRGAGFAKNCAGNFDAWRWREAEAGSIEAYRILSRDEAEALRRAMLEAAPPPSRDVPGSASNQPRYAAVREFLDGPCPICRGVAGCSHTVQERMAAVTSVLRFVPRDPAGHRSSDGALGRQGNLAGDEHLPPTPPSDRG